MNLDTLYNDLSYLLEHLSIDPEAAVKKWTNTTCKDPQIPIGLIIGYLTNAGRVALSTLIERY